jgi:hypothetical protein
MQVDGLRRGTYLGVNPRTHSMQAPADGLFKRVF